MTDTSLPHKSRHNGIKITEYHLCLAVVIIVAVTLFRVYFHYMLFLYHSV